jgi:hypothetical protein
MNDEVTVKRWERWVIRAVALYLVLVVVALLIAGLLQLVIEPTDPDAGKHEIKTIPSGVIA